MRVIVGNEIFVKIDAEFLLDNLNLTELDKCVPNICNVICYIENIEDSNNKSIVSNKTIEKDAEMLYGLIHERFIRSPKGMTKMMTKYQKGIFGTCPRFLCEHQTLLPFGKSLIPGQSSVSFYCPRCQDLYSAKKERHMKIDGAFFGPTFANMFVVAYPMLFIKPRQNYVGKLCGFKIHATSTNHPPKVIFDIKTSKIKTGSKPTVQFTDPLIVSKSPRIFILDVKSVDEQSNEAN